MEFIVHNLTPLDLSISASDSAEAKGTFVSALSRASFTLGRRPRWHASLIIRGEAEENRVVYELTQSRLQLLTRKTWALASDDHAQNVPWRIYIRRVSFIMQHVFTNHNFFKPRRARAAWIDRAENL